jgi:hypothetical protein
MIGYPVGSMTPILLLAAWTLQDQQSAPAPAPTGPQTISFRAALETTRDYRLEVDIILENTPLKFTSSLKYTVATQGKEGYAIRSKQSGAKLTSGGNDIPYDEVPETKVTYLPTGQPEKIEGADITAEDYRFQRLIAVLWPDRPVSAKDKWIQVLKATEQPATVPVESQYTLLSFETLLGRPCAKIGFEIKELTGSQPASAKGTIWIETATGLPVRTQADMSNAPIAEQAVTAKWSLILTTPPPAGPSGS